MHLSSFVFDTQYRISHKTTNTSPFGDNTVSPQNSKVATMNHILGSFIASPYIEYQW
jgi:hypothetical protein